MSNGTIIVISGGCGSTYLRNQLNAHKRPDVALFDKVIQHNLMLSNLITSQQQKEFKKRTYGWYTLNTHKTIEENMLDYLRQINKYNIPTILNGNISRIGPFFTNNKIDNVICLVRHPLHAMTSLLVHRHPEKVKRFPKGLNSKECIHYYADMWNSIIGDHLKNNIIIRYEFAKDDANILTNDKLKNIFKTWKSTTRNYNIINSYYEEMLYELVKNVYIKIYKEWKI